MKAAILVEQNAPLVIADVDIPTLDYGQVLVKVHYSGVCGKQLEEISGKRGSDPYIPHLLGHEGAGVVVDTGSVVSKVKAGDHVVLHWVKGSGIDSSPPRFQWGGTVVSSGWVTTFSEYAVVSENRITAIPSGIKPDVACLLGCAVTTGLGIAFNDAKLSPGQSIAVFGVGGVGVNVIQGAALVNAYPIIAIDLFDHKLEHAKTMGATHTINASKEDPQARLEQLFQSKGADVTVDVTGNTEVRQTAYNCTSDIGLTIYAGVPSLDAKITIDSFPLHFGRRVFGSHGGATVPDRDIPRYIQLYEQGKLKLDELITHRFSLDKINDAIDQVKTGDAGRCAVQMP